MSKSIIQWQTGEPTKEGLYLVQFNRHHYKHKKDTASLFDTDTWQYNFWEYYDKEEIVAWCPLDSIEPYKEIDYGTM